nr:hypothetical protein [Tanacetum cinerariifolium]
MVQRPKLYTKVKSDFEQPSSGSPFWPPFSNRNELVDHPIGTESAQFYLGPIVFTFWSTQNGSIKKVEKRGNMGEPRKDKSGKDANKGTRIGNVFVTTMNPIGRENTGNWPKCSTCNSYHATEGPCRTCFNGNRPSHLEKDRRGVPRNVNHVNARNPPVKAW